MTVSARSRISRSSCRSSAIPSRSRPSPWSGCGRRTGLEAPDSTASEASRNRIRCAMPACAQRVDDVDQVGEELAAPDVHDRGEPVHAARAGGEHPGQLGEQLGRQVVDDVPVQVLQDRGGLRAARTGHPGDHQELRAGPPRAGTGGRPRARGSPSASWWPGARRSCLQHASAGQPDPEAAGSPSTLAPSGGAPSHSGHGRDLLDGRRRESGDRAEVLQQRRPRAGPSPGTSSSVDAVMPLLRRARW